MPVAQNVMKALLNLTHTFWDSSISPSLNFLWLKIAASSNKLKIITNITWAFSKVGCC